MSGFYNLVYLEKKNRDAQWRRLVLMISHAFSRVPYLSGVIRLMVVTRYQLREMIDMQMNYMLISLYTEMLSADGKVPFLSY